MTASRRFATLNHGLTPPGQGGARRVGAGAAKGDAARRGKVLTIILLNLACQPQTNFGRVKDEILGPTESGISPLRRA
jgi:hypothetical protein